MLITLTASDIPTAIFELRYRPDTESAMGVLTGAVGLAITAISLAVAEILSVQVKASGR